MSNAEAFLATLFKDRYNFLAPDSGRHKLPYTCSFHWFHTPDGQLIGVDLVRSDDTGRRGLRVFAARPDGGISSLILEGPSSEWAPFATDSPPVLPQDKPILGRGENWVAASASVSGQSINAASFELHLKVLVPGRGTGESGLALVNMTAMDYVRLEVSGWINLNGQRTDLDRVIGYASIHYGAFLPNYAGIASVPPQNPSGAGILVNVTDADDLKHGGSLLGDQSVVYGYGSDPIPEFFLTVGKLQKGTVPLGLGGTHLDLSDLKGVAHQLLDRPTTTAVANATYVDDDGSSVPIGQVILDFRGTEYAALVNLS